MVVLYMIAGTCAGLLAGVLMGVATGSVLLALPAWTVVGAGTALLIASVAYARESGGQKRPEVPLIPAE